MQEDAVGMVKNIVGSMVCVYNSCQCIVHLKKISSLGCETSYMLTRELVAALGHHVTMFCPHTVFSHLYSSTEGIWTPGGPASAPHRATVGIIHNLVPMSLSQI